jgi:hypothetical protein
LAYYNIYSRGKKFCCQVRWSDSENRKRYSKNKTFKTKGATKTWGELKLRELEKVISNVKTLPAAGRYVNELLLFVLKKEFRNFSELFLVVFT